MLFTVADIARNFDARDNGRGKAYQAEGRVEDVIVKGGGRIVEARVRGNAQAPYRVWIEILKNGPRTIIEAECTCPVGYKCKHAAAALYEALAEEIRAQERKRHPLPMRREKDSAAAKQSSPRLNAWLARLEAMAPFFFAPEKETRLVYLLRPPARDAAAPSFFLALQQKLKDGAWTAPRKQNYQQLVSLKYQSRGILSPEDESLLKLATAAESHYGYTPYVWTLPSDPAIIDLILRRAIGTGRAFWGEATRQPLSLAPPLPALLGWTLLLDGSQRSDLKIEKPGAEILLSPSPWYVLPLTGEAGPLLCGTAPETLLGFLGGPPLDAAEAETLRRLFKTRSLALPAPRKVRKIKSGEAPIPRLAIQKQGETGTAAFLSFVYEGHCVHPMNPSPDYQVEKDDEILLRGRDARAEEKILRSLEKLFRPSEEDDPRGLRLEPPEGAPPWFWTDFLYETAPKWRRAGFEIETGSALETEILAPDDDDIEAEFAQNGEWWFSLDLGISVGGRRVKLLPLLVAMIRRLGSLADVDKLAQAKTCYVPLPDGRQLALPGPRVHTILKTLVELLGDKALDEEGKLRVSMDLAAAFIRLEGLTRHRWLGASRLKELVEKLASFEGIEEKPLPKNLKAKLRPYQVEGYHWLHFLGDYGLSGILADDMGLGKTVQALAYIQALKESGRLKEPCLIVMPTSLVANWQAEIERFTPELKTLVLHGKERLGRFGKTEKADVVLTTYPLLPRDGEELSKKKWSLIVLDEAQAVKNPSAKMTQAACALQARQRLCLTGTPVENHLGEAWSLFTFLMPGLLGDHKSFAKHYRNPIEKSGDADRKILLAQRLKPFVLRRLKCEVARELPPKTEMVRRVTLADDQRDLYEAVRHVMSEKVREEIAAKGIARSQIVILDALLKLRQVCCDPRLVKLEAARKVKGSAKLEELMEMIPTLIEDERKILLFSQFTSMLDLIKPELEKAGIPFVELRGTTKDRAAPVKRFQSGEVPLFLISLKAGGTGLNLTAADTVIHYDPWWNPAVENQATDRAHRIGQDKPVFVYKMIAEGTLEERILELQTKKAGLAAALFGEDPAAAARLTPKDLEWLLGS